MQEGPGQKLNEPAELLQIVHELKTTYILGMTNCIVLHLPNGMGQLLDLSHLAAFLHRIMVRVHSCGWTPAKNDLSKELASMSWRAINKTLTIWDMVESKRHFTDFCKNTSDDK